MADLFSLTCPTCGASLQIDGERELFQCSHCGNKYLLDNKVRELDELTRQHLAPVVTYTKAMKQWLRVAEYDVILRGVANDKAGGEKIFYIEVEYENKTTDPVKYRHDQWVVFDTEGHSFEPVKDFTNPQLYTNEKIYLGMTRVLNPGMKLRGWLAFVLPGESRFEYLQFSGGTPIKTVEFRLQG
jgi:DNA-directed RNA polymerase subunit RPC12/RpoP